MDLKMPRFMQALLIFTILLKDYTYSLRLLEVRIPKYVIKGSVTQLECLYDLDGEALYSVKWYKDGNEFYRYVPRDMPPAQTFLLPGVSVDLHNSSDAIVTLKNVNLQTTGRFRCEVSGEAPSFQTVTEHADMVVVSLPDKAPQITGGRPRYIIGDWVNVNCTAGRSKPAVNLAWYVNGEPVEPYMTRRYDTIISGREGLETSILGLRFRVDQHHFRNGDMKLKCVASLSSFYWRSNEESVEGDRPQKAPVLESRETVYASNSRADPVQGTSYREIFVTKLLSFFIQPNAANGTNSLLLAPNFFLMLIFVIITTVSSRCLTECLHLQQLPTYRNQVKELKSQAKEKKTEIINNQQKLKVKGATSILQEKFELQNVKVQESKVKKSFEQSFSSDFNDATIVESTMSSTTTTTSLLKSSTSTFSNLAMASSTSAFNLFVAAQLSAQSTLSMR